MVQSLTKLVLKNTNLDMWPTNFNSKKNELIKWSIEVDTVETQKRLIILTEVSRIHWIQLWTWMEIQTIEIKNWSQFSLFTIVCPVCVEDNLLKYLIHQEMTKLRQTWELSDLWIRYCCFSCLSLLSSSKLQQTFGIFCRF